MTYIIKKIPAVQKYSLLEPLGGIEEIKVNPPYDALLDFSWISNMEIRNSLIDIFNKVISISNKEMMDYLLNVKGLCFDKDQEKRIKSDVKIYFFVSNIIENKDFDYEQLKQSLIRNERDRTSLYKTEEETKGYSIILGVTRPKEDSLDSNVARFIELIEDDKGIPKSYEKLIRGCNEEEVNLIKKKIDDEMGDASDEEKIAVYRKELSNGITVIMDKEEKYTKELNVNYEGVFSITIDKTILEYYIEYDPYWQKHYAEVLCHELAHVYCFMKETFKCVMSASLEMELLKRYKDLIAQEKMNKLDKILLKNYTDAKGNGPSHSKYNIHDDITKKQVEILKNYLKKITE